jgi:hypothetical protein
MIAFIRALPILTRVIAFAGAVLFMLGAYKAWEWKQEREGAKRQQEIINAKDRKAIDNAGKQKLIRKDCVDAFGVDAWNVTDGVCKP